MRISDWSSDVCSSDLLYKSVGYDTLKDFTPIGTLIDFPLLMVARPDAPFDDFQGFLKYAKAHPGELDHTSSGSGTLSHLGMELLQRETGTKLVHVPYKGSARALTDIEIGRAHVSTTVNKVHLVCHRMITK